MTKDDIIKLAREAGLFTHKEVQPELEAFANLVAAAEREACAKLAGRSIVAVRLNFADAIRARGNT
jgi:hypothetical protein